MPSNDTQGPDTTKYAYQVTPTVTPESGMYGVAQPGAQPLIGKVKRRRSKLKLFIGGLLVVAAIVCVALFFTAKIVMSDSRQSQKISHDFIAAVTQSDGHAAYELLAEDAQQATQEGEYRAFVKASEEQLIGDYEVTGSQIETKANETRAYYLYTFPTAKHKYVRTILLKKAGKWGVISFVHSSEKLELVPTSITASINSDPTAQ